MYVVFTTLSLCSFLSNYTVVKILQGWYKYDMGEVIEANSTNITTVELLDGYD